jgi:hypothetical protein
MHGGRRPPNHTVRLLPWPVHRAPLMSRAVYYPSLMQHGHSEPAPIEARGSLQGEAQSSASPLNPC